MKGRITEKAYSKLNLSLDVLGKRDDGYHEMLMVMQSISLCDDISISFTDGEGNIVVNTNRHFLPTNEKNLAFAAAKRFLTYANICDTDLRMDIKKNVPVCAGMGGGSSDAAAVLRALNKSFGNIFNADELMKIGAEVGSDVPFCITGGTMLAFGRGTEFRELSPIPECSFAIVKPSFSIKTPELFNAIDKIKTRMSPDTEGLVEAINASDVDGIARRCFNVFEDALPQKQRDIVNKAKLELIDAGALGAAMTGTGSAVYGVFKDKNVAKNAVNKLKQSFRETYYSDSVPKLSI